MTLGSDIRSLDPTGITDLYLTYNAVKTTLTYTKIAADIAATAIETGSVQDAIITGAQSVANSYVPASIRNMAGSIFGR